MSKSTDRATERRRHWSLLADARPLLLPATSIAMGALAGGLTNAIHGVISPTYFRETLLAGSRTNLACHGCPKNLRKVHLWGCLGMALHGGDGDQSGARFLELCWRR